NHSITDQDIDDAGSAIKFGACLSDLFARNQPDLLEHFQHIIVVSLHGELIPVIPFKAYESRSPVSTRLPVIKRGQATTRAYACRRTFDVVATFSSPAVPW